MQDSDDSDEVIFSDDVGDDDDGDEENESINSDKEDLDEEFQDNSMEEKGNINFYYDTHTQITMIFGSNIYSICLILSSL